MNHIREFKLATIWLLSLLLTTSLSAQKSRTFDLESTLLSPAVQTSTSFGFSGRYNVWFAENLAYTVGARVFATPFDAHFSTEDRTMSYDIANLLISLRGEVGLKWQTPATSRVGFFADLSFLFAPIPFNRVSMERKRSSFTMGEKSNINKIVYTHFSPGYSLKMGPLYHVTGSTQIALGVEITSFNPYSAYYRATVDDIRLKEHLQLSSNQPGIGFFIRCSGIW